MGNQALLRLRAAPTALQARLKIGKVNDPLEHEADQVAEHIMRMPAPAFPASVGAPTWARPVSRKCDACEESNSVIPLGNQAALRILGRPSGSAGGPVLQRKVRLCRER
jgi:hypothetical protein